MKLQVLRDHLKEALGYAKMGNAGFGPNDELIKKETRLWRETWLIPSIEQALEIVETEIEKKRRK